MANVVEMALLHHATLAPTKLELLSAWLPGRPWFGGSDTATLTQVGMYRFDDPAGEVGIETLLFRTADDVILQIPVTYRAAPLPATQAALIGTAEHSVLGRRWVYDATADPVYAAALALAILTGGTQADIDFATDTGLQRWEPTTRIAGSGSAATAPAPFGSVTSETVGPTTVIAADGLRLVVFHLIDTDTDTDIDTDTDGVRTVGGPPVLTGTWPGQDAPATLAAARPA